MRIEIRITSQEDIDLVMVGHEDERYVYLSFNDHGEVLTINVEELRHALRVIGTK